MLCQNCNQNEASVVVNTVINGVKSTKHLCSKCASQMGFNTLGNFGSMLNSLFAGGFGLASPESIMDKVCPACGYHFAQFRSNGLLGCDQCYESFKEELRPVIKRIQGSVIDKPDAPAEEAKVSPEDKLKLLKEELARAVAAEEYERAAQIRDQIRAQEETKN